MGTDLFLQLSEVIRGAFIFFGLFHLLVGSILFIELRRINNTIITAKAGCFSFLIFLYILILIAVLMVFIFV